jgi:hypothetical protein
MPRPATRPSRSHRPHRGPVQYRLLAPCTQRLLTLCAAHRLHLAKFERAILGLLLASNALAAAPDSDKPSEAAVDVRPPPPPPHF